MLKKKIQILLDLKINVFHMNKKSHSALVTTIIHRDEFVLMKILPLLVKTINKKNN